MPLYTYRVNRTVTQVVEFEFYGEDEATAESMVSELADECDEYDWEYDTTAESILLLKQEWSEGEDDPLAELKKPRVEQLRNRIEAALAMCHCEEASCPTCQALSGS